MIHEFKERALDRQCLRLAVILGFVKTQDNNETVTMSSTRLFYKVIELFVIQLLVDDPNGTFACVIN